MNRASLVSEVTALPIASQPLPLDCFLQYKKNISPYIRATHVFKLSDWLAIFLTHSGG